VVVVFVSINDSVPNVKTVAVARSASINDDAHIAKTVLVVKFANINNNVPDAKSVVRHQRINHRSNADVAVRSTRWLVKTSIRANRFK
jgi:hypothetical protein